MAVNVPAGLPNGNRRSSAAPRVAEPRSWPAGALARVRAVFRPSVLAPPIPEGTLGPAEAPAPVDTTLGVHARCLPSGPLGGEVPDLSGHIPRRLGGPAIGEDDRVHRTTELKVARIRGLLAEDDRRVAAGNREAELGGSGNCDAQGLRNG